MSWRIRAGVNGGYPTNTGNEAFASPPQLTAAYVMRIDGTVNDGYPHSPRNPTFPPGMTPPLPYGVMRIDPSGVVNY